MFAWGVPPEAYDEVIYFFPLAVRYLLSHPKELLLMEGLTSFSAKCDAFLLRDGLKVDVINSFLSCLDAWTSTFSVVHHDREQMKSTGSPLQYADYVVHSFETFSTFASFVRNEVDVHVAEHYILRWCSRGTSKTNACWFLEFCRQSLEDQISFTSPMMDSMLHSRDLISHHYQSVGTEVSLPATYLADLRDTLHIDER